VPWALHTEAIKIAFGERAEAVGAKFLKSVKITLDLRDCYHFAINFNTQRFLFAEAFRLRNRSKNDLTVFRRRKVQCGDRCWCSPFVSADANAIGVNEAAAEKVEVVSRFPSVSAAFTNREIGSTRSSVAYVPQPTGIYDNETTS
jgi:hypothetical protein